MFRPNYQFEQDKLSKWNIRNFIGHPKCNYVWSNPEFTRTWTHYTYQWYKKVKNTQVGYQLSFSDVDSYLFHVNYPPIIQYESDLSWMWSPGDGFSRLSVHDSQISKSQSYFNFDIFKMMIEFRSINVNFLYPYKLIPPLDSWP